ncbi:hypothetical protein [Pontibacter burrus]|uniref:Uncharacterized protein n=1 Tax=Pontibacter burrus TaxID=2704466 RepID=A0A6B3LZG7_9BACT|nr:hypothetical protein [Pontibacter burrus]NEM98797.1 hypothetical protein [Pontibacter burrus]
MKKAFVIPCLSVLITCCTGHTKLCEEPREVYEYRVTNITGSNIISENELRSDWKEFVERDTNCPTRIDYDLTNDGHKDFICMLKDSTGMPYLVAFNNYKTPNISFQVIDGVADYGNYGIGNIIYLNKDTGGFYSFKLESSKAYIYWKDNKYLIEYND